MFALDVTDPADVKFLWEKRGTDIAALGKNIGRPVIAQVANGDWRVLIGNGPGTHRRDAQLVMIRRPHGAVTVVNTGAAGSNGLTAVLARDSNGDGFADTAYAGDLRGNFGSSPVCPARRARRKMFEARDRDGNAQPITAAPLVGKDPDHGQRSGCSSAPASIWVSNRPDQHRRCRPGTASRIPARASASRGDLVAAARSSPRARSADFGVRVVEEGAAGDLVSQQRLVHGPESRRCNGAEGERMVVPNRFQGQALIGTTRIPEASDACRPSGRGFIMAINPFTGARLDADLLRRERATAEFNDADMMLVDGELTPVSGIGFDSSPNNPIFIEDVMQVGLDDGTTETIKTQGLGRAGRENELAGNGELSCGRRQMKRRDRLDTDRADDRRWRSSESWPPSPIRPIRRYVARTHRNAAKACLSEYAQFMERYYTTNLSYAAANPNLACATESNMNERYTFAASNLAQGTYTVTATPIGTQASRDTQCAALGLDQAGVRAASGSGGASHCW